MLLLFDTWHRSSRAINQPTSCFHQPKWSEIAEQASTVWNVNMASVAYCQTNGFCSHTHNFCTEIHPSQRQESITKEAGTNTSPLTAASINQQVMQPKSRVSSEDCGRNFLRLSRLSAMLLSVLGYKNFLSQRSTGRSGRGCIRRVEWWQENVGKKVKRRSVFP